MRKTSSSMRALYPLACVPRHDARSAMSPMAGPLRAGHAWGVRREPLPAASASPASRTVRVVAMLAVVVASLCSAVVTVIAGIVLVTKVRTFHFPDPTLYVATWLVLTALMWAATRWLWRWAAS
jgi:uncharacterized BrkB/YihY/UPF0761 family membrane protein